MLALPVANAEAGFWASSFFLLVCWALMTLGAFYILEVNLYLPRGKHMVSMANATLGTPGLVLTWLCYLVLLYALLSAYISGGADVLEGLLSQVDIHALPWQLATLFTLVFGGVVYGGIRQVDWVNRVLMLSKLAVYAVLIVLIAPHVNVSFFQYGHARYITGSLMILMTSFGFSIIVPNLRDYFNDDIKTLKKVILIGSLIPLLCYLAWDAVIMGSLPSPGGQGLVRLMQSDHSTSQLALMLSDTTHNTMLSSFFNFFTSICMLTAFLGVSLCLLSFLGDGLNMVQKGTQGSALFLLTFVPPLGIVLFYPGAYLHALHYAGYCCVTLLLFFPALMSTVSRKHFSPVYVVPGGRLTQYGAMFSAILLLCIAAV